MIGFIAGIIARVLSPGPNELRGFIMTTALGIAGAFVEIFMRQTIGWYRLDQGAGLIGATVGALLVLFVWNRFVVSHAPAAGDIRRPGPTRGRDRQASLQRVASRPISARNDRESEIPYLPACCIN